MNTNAKFSELHSVTPAGNWVPISGYAAFAGIGVMEDADAAEGVTVQLRKATSAAGADAANHGTAVTALSTATDTDLVVVQDGRADDLGRTAGGVAYTHVSALVSKAGSPAPAESVFGVVIRHGGRFSE